MEKEPVRKEREEPTNNVVNVSAQRKVFSSVDRAKQVLEKFNTVELHAIGRAMKSLVQSAQLLQKNGYATLKRTELLSIQLEGRDGGKMTKSKIIVELAKSADFDKRNREFNQMREDNKAKYDKIN